MKKIISSLGLYFFIISSYTLAQFEFEDNFEGYYIIGQPLACQNPIDWTTWNYLPCSNEDPYISSNFSHSGTRSVKISFTNDLIKLLGNYSTGRNHITFYIYIPNGKTGEISLYSKFNPDPNELAFECYFDVGGSARLMSIPGEPVLFNYTYNQWHLVWVVVDFDRNEAQFYLDYNFIHIWEWTQNGTITNQLAAQNFFGRLASNEMYIDDYLLFEGNCLQCLPPSVPTNLTVQQIFNGVHTVQLNWQQSIFGSPRAYKILRKIGYPSTMTEFETLAYVPFSELQYVDSNIVIDSTYTYGVIAMNMYGYSDTSNFATITVEPVPVELISFSFELINNNVQLNWLTATETNNKGFEVERKFTENRSPEPAWGKIGFVEGHGTTTEPQFYSFTDESLQPGKYQYRLKQIDYDGTFEYSQIVEEEILFVNKFSLSQNYPNPFNPATSIQYTISSTQFVMLKVYDVLGNEVATLVNEEKSAGEYEVKFSVGQDSSPDISSGIYFYQLKAGSFIETKKMVLIR